MKKNFFFWKNFTQQMRKISLSVEKNKPKKKNNKKNIKMREKY